MPKKNSESDSSNKKNLENEKLYSSPTKFFENIYFEYEPKLKKYLTYLLPYDDEDTIQDFLQNIFLKIFEKINQEENFLYKIRHKDFHLNHYIYRIARNFVIDSIRKQKKIKEFSESSIQYKVESFTKEKFELKNFLQNQEENAVEDEILRNETYECIYYYINSLKIEYREIIYLYYFENLSLKEIAEKLEIEYGAASMRLQRARFRLRKILLRSCCVLQKEEKIYLECKNGEKKLLN